MASCHRYINTAIFNVPAFVLPAGQTKPVPAALKPKHPEWIGRLIAEEVKIKRVKPEKQLPVYVCVCVSLFVNETLEFKVKTQLTIVPLKSHSLQLLQHLSYLLTPAVHRAVQACVCVCVRDAPAASTEQHHRCSLQGRKCNYTPDSALRKSICRVYSVVAVCMRSSEAILSPFTGYTGAEVCVCVSAIYNKSTRCRNQKTTIQSCVWL